MSDPTGAAAAPAFCGDSSVVQVRSPHDTVVMYSISASVNGASAIVHASPPGTSTRVRVFRPSGVLPYV